jgi:uncharacterized protein
MEIRTQLQNLLKLQEIDNKLLKLNHKKESLPGKINKIKKAFDSINEKQKIIEEEKDKILKDRKKLDGEIEVISTKMSKYQEQLMDVKTNKEYSTMLSEIENSKAKKSEIEDKVLESLEFIDVYNKQLKNIQDEAKKVKDEVESKIEEIDQKINLITTEIEGLETERESLKSEIDSTLFSQYEKLYMARDYIALAKSNDSSCDGCNSIIRPHVLDQIREMKEIIFCERCQRILYWESSALTGTE